MKGLVLTYVVTYLGAAASLFYPLVGVYIYVCWAILRPQEIFGFAGDLSSISSIVGYALLAGWALHGFGSWRLNGARTSLWLLMLFVGLFLVSAAVAVNTTYSWMAVVAYAKLMLPLLAGVSLLNSEKEWRTLLWVIVLSQGYVGFEQNLNYAYKGYNTAQGGFGGMDNNFFGLSLVTTLGPAIALTLASKSWKARVLAAASTALIFHTILLTFSRGAMVGMLALGFVTVVFMPKRPSNIAALVVVLLLAVRFTGPQLLERYGSTFVAAEERDGSAQSRVDLWRDCLRVIQDYPFFGVGPANWRSIASRYGWSEGKSAHSVWMELAAEAGVPASLTLLAFFVITALKLLPLARARLTDENHFATFAAQGVVLGATGFVVSGQFVSAPALEVPYYVLLVGIALLKNRMIPAPATAPTSVKALPWQTLPNTATVSRSAAVR